MSSVALLPILEVQMPPIDEADIFDFDIKIDLREAGGVRLATQLTDPVDGICCATAPSACFCLR